MALFLDIETTGFPDRPGFDLYYPFKELQHYDSSRVVQVAAMLCNDKLEEVEKVDMVVRADGFRISNSEFHGITDEISQSRGVPMTEVGAILMRMMEKSSHIFAHNAKFDVTVLMSEFHRAGASDVVDALSKMETFCTMTKTKNILNIKKGRWLKNPTLSELFMFATGDPIRGEHNAMCDVANTHVAVKTLVDKKQLRLPPNLRCPPASVIAEVAAVAVAVAAKADKVASEVVASEVVASEVVASEVVASEHALDNLKFADLRKKCKELKISGYGKLNKKDLLEKLKNHLSSADLEGQPMPPSKREASASLWLANGGPKGPPSTATPPVRRHPLPRRRKYVHLLWTFPLCPSRTSHDRLARSNINIPTTTYYYWFS